MAILSLIFKSLPSLYSLASYGVLFIVSIFAIHILSQFITLSDPKHPKVAFSWVPYLGNGVEFGIDPISFLQKCQKKYGDVFTFKLMGRNVTVCLGADGNEFVFNSKLNVSSAAEAYNHMTKYVFGDDVVYDAPHSVFMEQKRFVKAGLTLDSFRQHVPMLVKETVEFFQKFEAKGSFQAYKTFSKLTINTASSCLMGKEIRASLDEGVADLYYDLDQGFRPINFVFSNLPMEGYRRRDEACRKMGELYSNIIKRRREENDNSNLDILQSLMESNYKDGSSVPDSHIAGMMIAVLFGGQHTSATTTAWSILELANRPDLIKALREEQIKVMGSLKTDLTYDNIKELTLMEACVKETLRLHPPIYQMMRKVVADKVVFEKTGHEIPKGNFLCAVPGVTQVDPQYFNEPKTYNPYRWIDNSDPVYKIVTDTSDANMDYGFGTIGVSSRSPFVPFGAGRHRCIGEQFGYMQIKTVIATFIRLYDFSLEQGKGVPSSDYTSMVVIPTRPDTIVYTARQ